MLQGDVATPASRTTRIFVARIPQSVTDTQFRAYFEKYGKLQDAYMPRDHSRQMYRGIGFVTFASPESVEKVMACKHWCVAAVGCAVLGAGLLGMRSSRVLDVLAAVA
jgi:RNA recognition motif-containing protein